MTVVDYSQNPSTPTIDGVVVPNHLRRQLIRCASNAEFEAIMDRRYKPHLTKGQFDIWFCRTMVPDVYGMGYTRDDAYTTWFNNLKRSPRQPF